MVEAPLLADQETDPEADASPLNYETRPGSNHAPWPFLFYGFDTTAGFPYNCLVNP